MHTLSISSLLGAVVALHAPPVGASWQDSSDGFDTHTATAPSSPRPPCQGPFKHHINMHVYHLTADIHNATTGLTNKDAVNTGASIASIFTTRGMETYYEHGLIEMVHVSVSSWGDYLACDGRNCVCPKSFCDMKRPGNVTDTVANTTTTKFSFPKDGLGKYWDYDNGTGCGNVEVHASCVIEHLATRAGCPGICSAKNTTYCIACVNKLADDEKKRVWDGAIFNQTCADSRRRRHSPFVPRPTPRPRPRPRPTPRPPVRRRRRHVDDEMSSTGTLI